MTEEIWRDIEGYEGLYQVSNSGRVRRLRKTMPPLVLKLATGSNGYLQVNLWRNRKPKSCRVHRLVAEAFIDKPDGKPEANHVNGNKSDNRVENLEWSARSENNLHMYALGLHGSGGNNPLSKLTNEKARYVRDNPDNLTGKQLAEILGVSEQAISNIRHGKTYKNT